jgi:hypothetical protein
MNLLYVNTKKLKNFQIVNKIKCFVDVTQSAVPSS